MKTISYIVTDRRTKNTIIAKICKENNIDNSNYAIYCNKYFNYMEYDNNISITLLSTIHKGVKVHTEAGWQINNDPQRLFINYIKKRK